MLERLDDRALDEIEHYLRAHAHENILLLSDLLEQRSAKAASSGLWADPLSLLGYRFTDRGQSDAPPIAVQGFYRYGRWLPHYEPLSSEQEQVLLDAMIADARPYYIRWLMGIERVVGPILKRLGELGLEPDYDERDDLCYVDTASLNALDLAGVRRATARDLEAIAKLRFAFEVEYFRVPTQRIQKAWCRDIARRYIDKGCYLAERRGSVVSMVAVEARLDTLTQIGAVYTLEEYRGQGLAKAVVGALAREELRRVQRVALTVRKDNLPARRAYSALGFRPWVDYRLVRLR